MKMQKTSADKYADNVTNPLSIRTLVDDGHQNPNLPALSGAQSTLLAKIGSGPTSTDLTPSPEERFLKFKIDSLKRKQRGDAFFNSLNDEQSIQLIRWLTEIEKLTDVHDRVQAPPPEGLGLIVNFSTLQRLRVAWRAEDLATFTDQPMFDMITDLEEQSDLHQSARIQSAISHFLHQEAFELARRNPHSPLLKDLLQNIQKLNDMENRRQRIALDRTRQKDHAHPSQDQTITRHHRVDLNIISTPAPSSRALPVVPLTDAQPPVEMIAPIPQSIIIPDEDKNCGLPANKVTTHL